jgi:serine phosphatase RsbU (regulator of sigma subunit)/anti-sigma regulatory factor (Ser/Thr protein kinase)
MSFDPRAADERTSSQIGEGQVFLGTGGEPAQGSSRAELANIYRLSDPILAELSLERLMDEQLTSVREILGVDTVAILLLNEVGDYLVARAAKGLEEEVELGVRIPVGRGFAGRVAAQRQPIFIADVNHADIMNPILRQKGISSMLGVPLIVEGNLLGVIHVGTLQPRLFTNEDAAALQLVASRVAPAIERARLLDALDREHRGALALQRSLLPERVPELAVTPVAAHYFPAKDEVGGDWYDVIEIAPGLVGLAIGDVAGHGVRAATLMGQLRTALRAYALDGYSPKDVLGRVDQLLRSIRGRGMATAIYATFEVDSGRLVFASAGHPPPIICGAGRPSRLLEPSAARPPLGTVGYSYYVEAEVTLEYDELVLLYTDGLVERRGESLDAGLRRLVDATQGARSPTQLCSDIAAHLIPAAADDDIAFLALQREPVADELFIRIPAQASVLADVRQRLRTWLRAKDVLTEDVDKILLACGEACANAIEHAYLPGPAFFEIEGRRDNGEVTFMVRDTGSWREPRGRHRGRGFTIIESLMDVVEVNTGADGTEVFMTCHLG